jgi:hypothetical protein
MGRKLPYTPKSHIMRYLRLAWLRSRERLKVLKEAKYTCCQCHRKQSRAKGKELKVEVHHKKKIDWDKIVKFVRKELLEPEQEVLCVDCHKKETEKQNESKATS